MEQNERKKIALALVVGLALVFAAAGLLYALWERAPALDQPAAELAAAASARPEAAESAPEAAPEPMPEGLAPDSPRQDGVYTILLAGEDRISGSTDTMLICRLDSRRHQLNVVSLPRDTIVNVDWPTRKLNSVYIGAINADGDGAESLLLHARRLLGFMPDCYAIVQLDTFMGLIDCLGGVDYDVPIPMDYDDDEQRLYIHLQPGMQHLNGYQAMGLVRFREGYITGDLGRIELQQDFMRDCLRQFISLGSIPNAREAISLLAEGLDTDLSAANMAWFMRQLLLCRQEDIQFAVMPFDDAWLQGYSYAVPQLWEWIEMINTMLNPYETPVGYGDLDIVYRDSDGYHATGGLQGDWYYEAPKEPPESEAESETETPEEGPTIVEVLPGEDPPSILDPTEGAREEPEGQGWGRVDLLRRAA